MKFRENIFTNDTVQIDNNDFIACRFESCTLVYGGGELGTIANCSFVDCRWELSGAASQTISFLRAMYHGMGDGGRNLVEDLLKKIQTP